jgi:HAD superfamily hydrolase (TIGR01549 family)
MVLFDLSGTIVDSLKKGDRDALEEVSQEFAHQSYETLKLIKDNRRSIRRNFPLMFGKNADAAYQKYLTKLTAAIPLSHLFNDCADVLGLIHENGAKVGLITNRSDKYTENILTYHGLQNTFDAVVTGENRLGAEKPAADMVYLALEQTGFSADMASSCLVVGDSFVDILCADNVNATPILFSEKELQTPPIQERMQDTEKKPLVCVPDYKALHGFVSRIAASSRGLGA